MNENLSNWESETEVEKRWVEMWVLHRKRLPGGAEDDNEGGEGGQEYRIFVFFDREKVSEEFKNKLKESLSSEQGWRWRRRENIVEEVEIINSDEAARLAKVSGERIKCGSYQTWADIDSNFNFKLTQSWQDSNFTYQQTRDWINNVGLNTNDYEFASWLRDTKQLTPKQVLDHIGNLRQEFQAYQENAQQAQIVEISPMGNPNK